MVVASCCSGGSRHEASNEVAGGPYVEAECDKRRHAPDAEDACQPPARSRAGTHAITALARPRPLGLGLPALFLHKLPAHMSPEVERAASHPARWCICRVLDCDLPGASVLVTPMRLPAVNSREVSISSRSEAATSRVSHNPSVKSNVSRRLWRVCLCAPRCSNPPQIVTRSLGQGRSA